MDRIPRVGTARPTVRREPAAILRAVRTRPDPGVDRAHRDPRAQRPPPTRRPPCSRAGRASTVAVGWHPPTVGSGPALTRNTRPVQLPEQDSATPWRLPMRPTAPPPPLSASTRALVSVSMPMPASSALVPTRMPEPPAVAAPPSVSRLTPASVAALPAVQVSAPVAALLLPVSALRTSSVSVSTQALSVSSSAAVWVAASTSVVPAVASAAAKPSRPRLAQDSGQVRLRDRSAHTCLRHRVPKAESAGRTWPRWGCPRGRSGRSPELNSRE